MRQVWNADSSPSASDAQLLEELTATAQKGVATYVSSAWLNKLVLNKLAISLSWHPAAFQHTQVATT